MGTLLGIAVKRTQDPSRVVLDEATITCETGVADDIKGKPGKRQVTVLSREAWDEVCAELGEQLPWTARRANLLVEGIDLADTVGSTLHVGEAILEITGVSQPCALMDDVRPGLRAVMKPNGRGGITCSVVQGGTVKVGDSASMQGPSPGSE